MLPPEELTPVKVDTDWAVLSATKISFVELVGFSMT
jgi:hypothetical protein